MPSRIDNNENGTDCPFRPLKQPQPPLGDAINRATRSVHARLNKLIIQRLPLALPPATSNASNYVEGLLRVAPVYMAFESMWRDIIHQQDSSDESEERPCPEKSQNHHDDDDTTPHCHRRQSSTPQTAATVSPRVRALLARLHMPALERESALRADLAALTGWSARTLDAHLEEVLEAAADDCKEEDGAEGDKTEKGVSVATADVEEHQAPDGIAPGRGLQLLSRTRAAIAQRPHVLLAYAWVLYMALFSGGRFIRASLQRTDLRFWKPPCDTGDSAGANHCHGVGNQENRANDEDYPLRFFRFDYQGDGDAEEAAMTTREAGEDALKRAFKARLAETETLLSPTERDDVVREACAIFDLMVLLVDELDDVCAGHGAGGRAGQDDEESDEETMPPAVQLLSLRSRDSVVVERERRDKAARVKTGSTSNPRDCKKPAPSGDKPRPSPAHGGGVHFC